MNIPNTARFELHLLFAVLTVFFVLRAVSMPYVPFIYYPFHLDPWTWLSQGLRYTGRDIDVNLTRPPLFPAIIAVLYKLEMMPLLPFVGILSYLTIAISAFFSGKFLWGKSAGWVALVLVLSNKFVYTHSYYLNPDMLNAAFVAAGFACLAAGSGKSVIAGWTLSAVSILAHNYYLTLIIFPLQVILLYGFSSLRKKEHKIGIALMASVMLLYSFFFVDQNYIRFYINAGAGTLSDTNYWLTYLVYIVFIITLPGALMIILSILPALLDRSHRPRLYAVLCPTAIGYAFFSFAYGNNFCSTRHIVYFVFYLILLTAYSVYRLTRKSTLATCAVSFFVALSMCLSHSLNPEMALNYTVIGKDTILMTDGTVAKSKTTTIFSQFYNADFDKLRKISATIVYPSDIEKIANEINRKTNKTDSFAVLPSSNRIAWKIDHPLELLSDRKSVPIFSEKIDWVRPLTPDILNTMNSPRAIILINPGDLDTGGNDFDSLNMIELKPYMAGGSEFSSLNMVKLSSYMRETLLSHLARNNYTSILKSGIFELFIRDSGKSAGY